MPTTSGFTNAPITRTLVIYTIASAIFATAADTKHYFPIQLSTSASNWFGFSQQWWRLLTWQLAYANSTEVLFAAVTFYHLRVVERLWGSRKAATFLVQTLPYLTLLPPSLLLLLRPLSANTITYLPSGPTSIIFALIAQYHAAIPYTFRYTVSLFPSSDTNTPSNNDGQRQTASQTTQQSTATNTAQPRDVEENSKSLLLTSKSATYLLPAQLAFSQLPGSLIPAVVGWVVGYAWRADLLPVIGGPMWRVPGWVVGEGVKISSRSESGNTREDEGEGMSSGSRTRSNPQMDAESLRRRMEREGGRREQMGRLRM